MPKKRTNDDQAPASEDRPLHAPAFEPPPAPSTEPDESADDSDTKDVS